MAMQIQKYSDTDAYLFDLGSAHNRTTYPDLVTFFAALINACGNDLGYNLSCYTNDGQAKERNFLLEIGFEEVIYGRIRYYFITREKLRDFRKNIKGKIEEAQKKRQKFLKEQTAKLLEGGRTSYNELRVGDRVVFAQSHPQAPTEEMYLETSVTKPQSFNLYYIDSFLNGRVVLRRNWDNIQIYNYDYHDYSWPTASLVRSIPLENQQ